MKNNKNDKKRYTLATRGISLEALIITAIFMVLMIIASCLIDDKRFLFIPLFFLIVCSIAFTSLLFRYITEPKIAVQADRDGIYFYYRNNKQVYISYNEIVEVLYLGIKNKYGRILISTKNNKYQSIKTEEGRYELQSKINQLLNAGDKEKYLIKLEK